MKRQANQKLIGITGNIACGKSTVSKYLRSKGYTVIDADEIVRELYSENDSGYSDLMKKISLALNSGKTSLSKEQIRQIVFTDASARIKLEQILHPLVQQRSEQKFNEAFLKGAKTVFYDAALLIEAGRASELDGILLITCDEKTRLSRAIARDQHLSVDIAKNIIAAQISQEEKKKYATWTIENNSSIKDLHNKIEDWLLKL